MIVMYSVRNILGYDQSEENHIETQLGKSKLLLNLEVSENFSYINKMLPLHIPGTFK